MTMDWIAVDIFHIIIIQMRTSENSSGLKRERERERERACPCVRFGKPSEGRVKSSYIEKEIIPTVWTVFLIFVIK